jgi:hypothetical protein
MKAYDASGSGDHIYVAAVVEAKEEACGLKGVRDPPHEGMDQHKHHASYERGWET